MTYPALGSPKYAHMVEEMAPEVKEDNTWGLDHGAWTILKHIFPDASIPAFQLSIDINQSMDYHYRLAQRLQKLRQKGVLIIGSGNIVHNLRLSFDKLYKNDKTPYDWALEFDAVVKDKINAFDIKSLQNYTALSKAASLSVPTTDHYIPLMYTMGLADTAEEIEHTYESVEYGGLSMRTIRIGAN
jgi:4,5-DOPA dioxygenase extradiol